MIKAFLFVLAISTVLAQREETPVTAKVDLFRKRVLDQLNMMRRSCGAGSLRLDGHMNGQSHNSAKHLLKNKDEGVSINEIARRYRSNNKMCQLTQRTRKTNFISIFGSFFDSPEGYAAICEKSFRKLGVGVLRIQSIDKREAGFIHRQFTNEARGKLNVEPEKPLDFRLQQLLPERRYVYSIVLSLGQ